MKKKTVEDIGDCGRKSMIGLFNTGDGAGSFNATAGKTLWKGSISAIRWKPMCF
jgi:hypothetical protein